MRPLEIVPRLHEGEMYGGLPSCWGSLVPRPYGMGQQVSWGQCVRSYLGKEWLVPRSKGWSINI